MKSILLRKSLAAWSGAILLAAPPAASAQSFSVNFADDQGDVTHRVSGWLSSWWHTRESPAHANLEIKPTP